MDIIADLHMHGKYSQACSKNLIIPNIEKYARIKGLSLVGTGDFTHPKWSIELQKYLVREENGIYYTKTDFPFILTTEIALVYTANKKGRRIHNIVLAPHKEVVGQITDYLLTKGRVDYDGRPIFKIPAPEFVESLRSISKDIEVIPAHIWTPWFGLLGSKSGFDTVEECFEDQSKHIHALETGLSSDPTMNHRYSKLDKYNLVSFSDAHSFWPWRMGREATILEVNKLTYSNILTKIKTEIKETIEVDPNYGKYHVDGHRKCGVYYLPEDTKKLKNICPVCKEPLTIGVLNRVEQLADREETYKAKNKPSFKSLIPLSEIIAKVEGKAVETQAVDDIFQNLIKQFNNELNILINVEQQDIEQYSNKKIAETIIKARNNELKIEPGFDGEYGNLVLTPEDRRKFKQPSKPQKELSQFKK